MVLEKNLLLKKAYNHACQVIYLIVVSSVGTTFIYLK